MDKQDFELARDEIIKVFGKPEYDMNDPVNESAKRLVALRREYASSLAKNKRQAKLGILPVFNSQEAKEIETEARRYNRAVPLYLTDADLAPFTPEERELLMTHFENQGLSDKELSKIHNKFTVHQVSAFLRSGKYYALAARVSEYIMPVKLRAALFKLVDAGNQKIIERLSEHYGLMKAQQTDININKPIEGSPELIQKLKELGDSE